MLSKILAVLLAIAISIAGIFAYKYKAIVADNATIAVQMDENNKSLKACNILVQGNTSDLAILQTKLAVAPKVIYRTKNIYKGLNLHEKAILDTTLPTDTIGLLEHSSKD